MLDNISHIIQKEIGIIPEKIQLLLGGSINKVYHCILNKNEVVVKLNIANKYPEMFDKEIKGLQQLLASKFKIPQPIANGRYENHDYLILEYIKPGKEINWEKFGENLANLHLITNENFGLGYDNYIGSLQQINSFENNWEGFYSNNRLLFLIEKARDLQLFTKYDCDKVEKLCNKLNSLLPKASPSLIHGDLWSGNLMSDLENNPVLIDPAVYYGHPEMDWAMLCLFGNYPKIAFEKYNEIIKLEPGFNERKELHQLYPMLVHLILFGNTYYGSTMNIINKYF